MAKLVLQQNSFHKEDNFTDNKWFWGSIWTSSVLVVYFILSVGLTFYQKSCIEGIFKYPLTMVVCHFILKWVSSIFIRYLMHIFFNRNNVFITCKSQVTKIFPIGFCSAMDIAFSNWGLAYVVVSVYTMTKSTTIIFILGFSLLFNLEKKSFFLVIIVGMISAGLFMFTYEATNFNLFGFLLVLFASSASGLRWTLAQIIMQRSDLGLKNPVDMLYYVQPWMIVIVLPIAILLEGGSIMAKWDTLTIDKWLAVMGGAFIALGMELSEFLVVVNMSSLTLSVAGIFKEVCIVALAVIIKGDKISKLNFVGLLLCLAGIICHVVKKANSSATKSKPLLDEATARFLPEGSTSSEEEGAEHDDSSTEVLFSVLNSRDR